MNQLLKDSQLVSKTQITERLASIRRQRDALCDATGGSNNIEAFRKRQAKIAKLTEREGELCLRLTVMAQSHEALAALEN